MNDSIDRDQFERSVKHKRDAWKATLDAVSQKLGGDSERIESAVAKTRDLAQRSDRFIRRHPWMFVVGAAGVGLALASARRRGHLALGPGRGVVVMKEKRSLGGALFRSLLGFAGRMVITGIVSTLTAEQLAQEAMERPMRKPYPSDRVS